MGELSVSRGHREAGAHEHGQLEPRADPRPLADLIFFCSRGLFYVLSVALFISLFVILFSSYILY